MGVYTDREGGKTKILWWSVYVLGNPIQKRGVKKQTMGKRIGITKSISLFH